MVGRWLLSSALLLGWVAVYAPIGVHAKVFHARDEALALAFPGVDSVERRNFFLTGAQRERIEQLARAPLESDMVTIYVGMRGGEVAGYAIFDTHLVRTLPETFLVVLSPDGAVVGTHLLAFYEPLDYMPGDRWLRQFDGRRLDDDLAIGRGVAAITGSTLTSRAVAGGVRRALALYAVLLGEK
ncbi:FMN-binding protein [Candidatus Binatia bacterium]|nr:FMN-binding protein [Candidatus Binatia bacterium]